MPEAKTTHKQTNPAQQSPTSCEFYEIHVKGNLVPRWSEWFEGFTVTISDQDVIILSGPVADQAALHGLVAKIRDLNLTLIYLKKV